MNTRKFLDVLEPLRVRRTWTHDAALRRVARVRRELETLRTNETRLARTVSEQARSAQDLWTETPNPQTHMAAVSWLAQRQAARVLAQQEIAAAKARLSEAIMQWEMAVAALDAVDKQTQLDRKAHAHALDMRAQGEADDEWLARKVHA